MEQNTFKKIQEDTVMNYDLLGLIIGKKIGSGVFRDVYEHAGNPKLVIKLAKDTHGVMANVKEFEVYQEVHWFTGNLEWLKAWFAPVKELSCNGNALIMERTYEKPEKKRPTEIPAVLKDTHYHNFGWIGNKFVCHDYGSQIFFNGRISNKMRKAYF